MTNDHSIYLPDIHEPELDVHAFASTLSLIGRTRPSLLVVGGDAIDFYQLSRFNKNPLRALELQSDCDRLHRTLSKLRKAAPKARILYLRGNHELRLTSYLWGPGVALESLRCLRVPKLLGFSDLGIEYEESGERQVGGLVYAHGVVARAAPGASARGELERHWKSGVSGHNHFAEQVNITNAKGTFEWTCGGCLCNISKVEYLEGRVANWQNGVVYSDYKVGRSQLLKIVRGVLHFGEHVING